MRIAFIVPAPFDAVSGGYGYDRRLVAGLRALGHEVRVVEQAGRHPLPDDAALADARAILDGLAEDEVPVIDGLGLPAFSPLVEALERRRAVALIHHPTAIEPGVPDHDKAALKERERILFPRMARLVTTSRLTAARLPEEFGTDPARTGVVEPGTDPAPRATGSGEGPCAILSVGVISPRKGHDVLLRALGRLTDLEWHLTIAGGTRDAVHRHALDALVEELGLAHRVTFAGEVTGEALEALWARSDIFALASWWEGYGMAAAEAMARGLPLALCKGGALAELMPEGAGVASPPGDSDSLSRALRRVIYDAPLRARMARASWEAGQALPRWEDRAAAFAAELEAAARG